MEFRILDEIGEDCLTIEDGEKLYELIFPILAKKEEVVLNFDGVDVFASPFFNAGIGVLLKDFDRDTLNKSLIFRHLVPEGRNVLKLVIENSARYYNDEQYRKAHDLVIEKHLEEE